MLTPLQKKFKDLCMYLGSNNKALYGALTIAASKGVLRPTFTMMDKKQDRDSRIYTAFREGLTGAVAFVSYLATDAVVEKLATVLAKKTNHLKELHKMQSTLSLITVSLTALFIIPGICNMATKPLLNFFRGKKDDQPQNPVSAAVNKPQPVKTVNFGNYGRMNVYHMNNFYNSGMKIGGV